jgi:hypothetical protein
MTSEDPRYGAPAYDSGRPAPQQPGWGPASAPGSAPGYDPAGYGQQQPVVRRNGLGVAALVLGILALLTSITLVGGIVLGLAAVVLGVLGRGRVQRREADNGGVATAGIVLGVLGIVVSAAIIALGVSIFNSDSGKKYQDCLNGAGSDRAAAQACADQFGKDLTN